MIFPCTAGSTEVGLADEPPVGAHREPADQPGNCGRVAGSEGKASRWGAGSSSCERTKPTLATGYALPTRNVPGSRFGPRAWHGMADW